MRLFMTRARVDTPVSPGGSSIAVPPSDLTDTERNSELELFRSIDLLEEAGRRCGLLPRSSEPGSLKTALVLKTMQQNLLLAP